MWFKSIVAINLVVVLLMATSALATENAPVSKSVVDAPRIQEYRTNLKMQKNVWESRAQVGGGTLLGPGEVVNIVTTYGNGDQLAEIKFATDANLYRVLIHPDGSVTTSGSGLDGKPICQCSPCHEVSTRNPNDEDCGAVMQQNPDDGKKYVICNEDYPCD